MRHRNSQGNMLAMVAATALLLVAVMLFGLSFLSTTRGHMGQKTAAEAAALVAAQDIGRIVVDTPECGTVGLCDQAPVGPGTIADDNWYCEVRSINELMATCRLDYIIADKLGDEQMKRFALQDRTNILKAKDSLFAEINKSCTPGGVAKDAYGKDVKTYDDAEAIYLRNNAQGSTYVAGSLKLDLGSLQDGVSTQSPVPIPSSSSSVPAGQTINGCYVSEVNIPYNGEPFVFASTGKQVALGDPQKFTKTIAGLPTVDGVSTQISAVVKIEADQKFVDQGREHIQHFVAVASPGNDLQHPTGGALTLSFPDGPVPELKKVKDLYQWGQMLAAKCDILSVDGGDFPVDANSSIGPPQWQPPAWINSPPAASDVAKLALYDWMRAAGSRINIESVVKMQNGDFDAPAAADVTWKAKDPFTLAEITLGQIPQGIMHIYSFDKDGSILYRSKTIKPFPYSVIAHKQLYAELDSASDLVSSVAEWKCKNVSMHSDQSGKPPKASYENSGSDVWLSQVYWERGNVLASLGDVNEIGGGHGGGGGGGHSHGGEGGKGDYEGGKGKAASYEPSVSDITGLNKYDFYCRDMVRQRGADFGGLHEGEPMDNPIVGYLPGKSIIDCSGKAQLLACGDNLEIGGKSTTAGKVAGGSGGGAPPIISRQDDFSSNSVPTPPYRGFSYGPTGGGPRPTYQQHGVCVDLRFRRQIEVGGLSVLIGGSDIGYVGEML